MRQIRAERITEAVAKLCVEANCHLSRDITARLNDMHTQETWP